MTAAKVLYLDIETSPMEGYFWGLKNQFIGLNQIKKDSEMLSFAARWKGDKKNDNVFASVMDVGKKEMLAQAHELISEADVLVTYFGSGFDEPTMRREFALAKMTPPEPHYTLDLFRGVCQAFKLPSYKLQHVLTTFGHTGKVQHQGFGLWLDFMAGDAKAYKLMKKYNIGDVTSLEWLDNRLGPWIKRPNMNLFDGEGCPSCGSDHIQKRGTKRAGTREYQQYQCQADSCGKWFRSSKAVKGSGVRFQ